MNKFDKWLNTIPEGSNPPITNKEDLIILLASGLIVTAFCLYLLIMGVIIT